MPTGASPIRPPQPASRNNPPSATVVLAKAATLRFGKDPSRPGEPLERHRYRPEEVTWQLRESTSLSSQDKRTILENAFQARRHAVRGQRLGNESGQFFAALLRFDDGHEVLGSNIQPGREIPLCDLRAALSRGRDELLESGVSKMPKVREVYLANADWHDSSPVPCADCLAWLNSEEFFAPDTRVIGLGWEAKEQRPNLNIRTVADLLPYHRGRLLPRFVSDQPLDKPPVQRTRPFADLPEKDARRLLEKAKRAYKQNTFADRSGKNTGAAVLISPFNLMLSASRFDWSGRTFSSPGLNASEWGLRLAFRIKRMADKLLTRFPALDKILDNPVQIKALAWYGDDPQLPPISDLGWLAKQRVGKDTPVITVETPGGRAGMIHIRGIGDYLPEVYQ